MDALSFIAQVLDRAIHILVGLALTASVLYVAREAGLEPINKISEETYAGIIVAGIIGACITLVRGVIVIADTMYRKTCGSRIGRAPGPQAGAWPGLRSSG